MSAERVESELVAGCLLHPDVIPHVIDLVAPSDLENVDRREVFRLIVDAWSFGYFVGRRGCDRGYQAVGALMADRGVWTGRLFALGDVDYVRSARRCPGRRGHQSSIGGCPPSWPTLRNRSPTDPTRTRRFTSLGVIA